MSYEIKLTKRPEDSGLCTGCLFFGKRCLMPSPPEKKIYLKYCTSNENFQAFHLVTGVRIENPSKDQKTLEKALKISNLFTPRL